MNRTKATEGFALMTVLVMIVVLIALTTAYFFLTNLETATTQSNIKSTTGFYSAEAGLNIRGEEVRQSFQNGNRPSGKLLDPKTACKTSADYTAVNSFDRFYCKDYELNGRKVVTYVVQDPANLDPTDSKRTVVLQAPDPFAGLNAIQYRYEVVSKSYSLNDTTRPEAQLSMVFRSRLIPVFQFAAFYNKDLEILPGPDMTLNGRVHVNGDLYLNANDTLNIGNKVTVASTKGGSGGNLYRRRKDSSSCTGTVRINDAKGGTNPTYPALTGCGLKEQKDLTPTWNEQIQTKMDTITAPQMNSFAIGEDGWQQSDLRIALDVRRSTPKIIVPNVNVAGTSSSSNRADFVTENAALTAQLESCTTPTLTRPYNLLTTFGTSAIQTKVAEGSGSESGPSKSFFDNREKKDIVMLEVDIQGVLECLYQKRGASGLFRDSPSLEKDINDTSQGGLVIYLTVLGPESKFPNPSPNSKIGYGVRVRNGAQLKAKSSSAPEIKGLTIISDQALYVMGNYNQEGIVTTGPAATQDKWKPASFLVDSLNILSNAWNNGVAADTRSKTSPTTLIASDTMVNAALLSSTDITGGSEGSSGQNRSKYNGGLENYPRFHEKWAGKTLTYKGSFVSLEKARHVYGEWEQAVYSAPNRAWGYDERFNDPEQLPPLAPRFVYLRQELFSRDFDR